MPASGPTLVANARAVQVGSTICVVTVEVQTQAPAGLQVCAIATATLRVVDMPAIGKTPASSPAGCTEA